MNCSTLLRLPIILLFALILLTSPTLSLPRKATQNYIMMTTNEDSGSTQSRIAALKTDVVARMASHQTIISTHMNAIVTDLTLLGESIAYTDILYSSLLAIPAGPSSRLDVLAGLSPLLPLLLQDSRGWGDTRHILLSTNTDAINEHMEAVRKEVEELDRYLRRLRGEMGRIREVLLGKVG